MTNVEMAWIDMETTGLDANLDVPLELGIVLTDNFGDYIAGASFLIQEHTPEWDMALARGHANTFVHDMHTKSGLWRDLNHLKVEVTRDEVDRNAVEWMVEHGARPQYREDGSEFDGLGMAGNSIGSLDRPFALQHFPRLNAFLGYRNIDMSSFKEVCKRTNPGLYQNLKPIIGTKADATHRVLGDCMASIREYQAYLENFVITGDED